jgi:cell division protein FtsB
LSSKKNEKIISSFYKNLINEMQEQIAQKDAKIQEIKEKIEQKEQESHDLVDSLKYLK